MNKRLLPIGIQTFREIRERECYYVDKTAYHSSAARRGQALLPVASASVWQESVLGHAQGGI